MGTEYKLLKDRVEKLGDILSAVDFDSPVVASHLLVAACVEGYRVYGALYNLCRKGKSMILTLGYRVSEPLEPDVQKLADMLEKMVKDDSILVYFKAYQSNVLEKTSRFDFLLEDVEEAQKDIECALEDEKRVLKNIYRFCLDQSCCPLKIDHVSHYKSIYPMMDFLRSLMNELKKCAAKIDASVSSPTAEMVACWMKNSFKAFKEKGLEASFLKKCFESDRRKVRLRNKSELEFLEKELDGYLNADGDSLLGAALFRNYDMESGECDFMKTAWEVLPDWDCVNDESTTDLEDYAENLMMAAYVRGEIARISGEQKAKDEATDFYIEDEGNINEVADLSKGDVISKSKRSKNNSGRSLIFRTEEEQRKWAESFNEFLKKHKQFNEKGLTKEKDSYINRALAFFVDAWKKEGIYNTESYNNAPSGFLYYYCEIRGIGLKTHGNACQQIIKDCLGNKDDAILQAEVLEWVKKHL